MWTLLLCVLAGCGLLRPDTDPFNKEPSVVEIQRLTNALTAPGGRNAVISTWLEASGLTPLAGGAAPFDARRYSLGAGDSLLGGFIPGRHPVIRSELVVAEVRAGDPLAAHLMEAIRVLVQRSQTENVPSRTVFVAFYQDHLRPRRSFSLWPRLRVQSRLKLEQVSGVPQYSVHWPQRDTTTVNMLSGNGGSVREVNELLALLLHLTSPADTAFAAHTMPGIEK